MSSRYQSISTSQEYAGAVAQSRSEPVLIYKHSTMCELCTWAKRNIQQLSKTDNLPVYEVAVQTARPLSNAIEQALGIRHESPQGILLSDETPIFNASHRKLTKQALRGALKQQT